MADLEGKAKKRRGWTSATRFEWHLDCGALEEATLSIQIDPLVSSRSEIGALTIDEKTE